MRLHLFSGRRKLAVAACATVILAVACAVVYVVVGIERQLADSSNRIVVEESDISAPDATGVTLWMPEQPARDVEPFAGSVYVATESGLCVYDEHGRLARRITTLDGLPENSMTCLERFEGRLFIGTERSGLLAFDGQRFVRFRFVKPASSRVTALRAVNGRLLVGTFDNGVFEYDGSSFSRDFERAAGQPVKSITAILDSGPRVYVATFDRGLFEWREGAVRHVGADEGLPSDRVTALCLDRTDLLVGTDRGVARLRDDQQPVVVDSTANVTGIATHGSETWMSSLTSGVTRLETDDAHLSTRPAAMRTPSAPLSTAGALGLKTEDGVLWSMRDDGLFASIAEGDTARFERFDEAQSGRHGLSEGHVSGLAVDSAGRLWAGLFDGGVDVVNADSGESLWHFSGDEIHEVNAVTVGDGGRRVWIGTSRGLTLFENGIRVRTLDERSGLVSANVAGIDLGPGGDGAVTLATSEGVSVVDGTVTRSVTAFHGLPSNHAYCVVAAGGKTYVGTLGGLAQMNGLRVERVFSTANSKLPHNWVNALAAVNGRVYVGTYGGGVATLLPGGDLVPEEPTAGLEVNPGAMAVVGNRLFVGTLRSGVWMLNFDSRRWTKVEAVLSSENVTAIAANDRYVFLGTENGITRIERRRLGMDDRE